MLKMILADDESMVRNGLRNIINWKEYGVQIVAEATDGQEAYELCMERLPDILFTDIRMPYMDGLEVAERLKEEGNSLKVIIFSGVQDFGYAKLALNVNAEGYILKPLDVEELKRVVQKVVKQIHNERNIANKVKQLKQELHENFGAAREKFLRDMILGIARKEEDMIKKLSYFQNPILMDENIIVAVLQVDEYSKRIEHYGEEEKQLLSFSIANIVEEILHSHSRGICIPMDENKYGIVCNEPQDLTQEEENPVYAEIVGCLEKYLGVSVSIGVGPTVRQLSQIHSAYKEAIDALAFKFYTGNGTVIHITDVCLKKEKNAFPDLYNQENDLVNLVKLGNVKATEKAIQDIFDSFEKDQKYTKEYVQRICDEIVYITSRAMYELGENIDHIICKREDILDSIYQEESIFALHQRINSLLIPLAQHFSQKYTQKNTKVIEDIKKMIQEQYMEDISIKMIAETVYLSPNYISTIFNQETGETISDYISKTRMEAAKVLLRETDYKILDISEMVGFSDSSYFGKVFKKYTGIHPQKYRALGN